MTTNLAQLTGTVEITLKGADGFVKEHFFTKNLITDTGDLYYATMGAVGVQPANPSAPTLVTGIKLGTGTTAASKAGAGAAMVTYLSGSNATFDTGKPTAASLGSGLGSTITYSATWAAGTATNSAITEAVIVNDAASDATSTAGNTIARAVFTAVDKGVSDELTVVWVHKLLGS